MVSSRRIGIACTAAWLSLVSGHLVAQDPTLPSLSGRSLNDDDVQLPSQLPAAAAILIFTFAQEQQSDADRWIQGLVRLRPDCPYLEVAVINPVNAFVRGMIGAGMRRGIQDPARRGKFVTVFTSVERVAAKLPCAKGLGAVCVVSAEPSGRIRRGISGAYNDEDARSILASLAQDLWPPKPEGQP